MSLHRNCFAFALALFALGLICPQASQAVGRDWAEPAPGARTDQPATPGSTDLGEQLPFDFGDSYPIGYAHRILSGNFDEVPGPDLVTDDGTIWLNDGHGGLTAGPPVGVFFFAFTVDDIDGDGFDDIVTADHNEVVLYRCRGDGTFEASPRYELNFDTAFAVATGDLDGDGYPEILLPHERHDALTVIDNRAGQLGDARTYPPPPWENFGRWRQRVGRR